MKNYDSSKKENLSFTGMQIICMGGELVIPFPYGEFNWFSEKEINKLDLVSISKNSSLGYF